MHTQREVYLQRVTNWSLNKPAHNRIVRYFPDTFLGNGHRGLSKIALDSGVKVETLEPGEFIIFVNKGYTALKMFASGNVVAHLKMPQGSRLDPMAIKFLPMFFSGGKIDWGSAITKRIEIDLRRKV